MILPRGMTGPDLLALRVPAEPLARARRCFAEEDYAGSLEILGEVFTAVSPGTGRETAPLLEALALHGWNLLQLRDFEALTAWRDELTVRGLNLASAPELELVELWWRCLNGDYESVIDASSTYIEQAGPTLSPLVAGYLFIRGFTRRQQGNYELAIEDCEIAYSFSQFLSDPDQSARSANVLGMINYLVAEFPESLKWYARAQKFFTELGLLQKQSMVHLNTGIAHYKIGDYPAAFASLLASHEIGVQGGWMHRQCFSNIALGNVYRLTHDFQQARQHLHTAYNQAQELGFPREEALALEFLGDVYRDEDQPAQARRFYNRALAIGRKIAPEGDIVMEVHRRLGECLSREGNVVGARVELEKALQLARTQGDRFEEGVILRVIGEIGLAGGDLGPARTACERSIGLLRRIGARHELAISLLRAAELALAELERDAQPDQPLALLGQAWDLATQALDLFLQIDVDHWTLQTRGALKRISQQREAHEQAARQALTASGEAGKVGYRAKDVIIHTSSRMRELLQLCDMFAASDEPVLVTGETGTGKELIARRIHAHSGRSAGNLVTVNVAAIPQTLFEREFFGHVRGAFSGADRDGLGYAARADGGTLFLDEIGDLPLEAQPKLLRLLQEGAYLALGDPVERRASIRLIAATNADLGRLVREGKFRSDLYYRLKILELDLPPVRERVEDVQPLLRHFLSLAAGRPVAPAEFFCDTSLKLAEQHDWPGNVREIAMVARQAKIQLETTGRVEIELNQAVGTQLVLTGPRQSRHQAVAVFDRMDRLADFKGRLSNRLEQKLARDRTRIELALAESEGNCTRAARLLGISRSTLYRKMKTLGISRRGSS